MMKTITLKHLLIKGEKKIGLQYYSDKVINALVKELPDPRWSREFGMVYLNNTKPNLDALFRKFKGVAWINCAHFFPDSRIRNNAKPNLEIIRNREISESYRVVPEEYLLKLELKRYSDNTVRNYVYAFERFINQFKTKELMEITEMDIRDIYKAL